MHENSYQSIDKKIVILDGARHEDRDLDSILTILVDVLRQQYSGSEIKIFRLRDIKINHCIGCFNCFFKTPGRCVHTDAGSDILRTIVNSNMVIFFTPIVFGGYSSELKKMIDRFLPVALPFLKESHGETHHPLRYSAFPHIIGIGVHPAPDKELEECFKVLVGRNALNLQPSCYSTEVVNSSKDYPKKIHNRFSALITRTEKLPLRNALSSLPHKSPSILNISQKKRRVLLIIGSPRKNTSTSAVLGKNLLNILQKNKMLQTDILMLNGSLMHNDEQQYHLCRSVERTDIILLSFPLYVDSLPSLVIKALEVISAHKKITRSRDPKIILTIINNSFESYQNAVALAICQNFAFETGMAWAGGLTMGAAEALVNGKPLTGFRGFRGAFRPPLLYVTHSLKTVAKALAKGEAAPEHAVRLLAKQPVPLISPSIWHYLLLKISNRLLKKEAKRNGLDRKAMFNQPYAE